jgi:tetratricopeptide (TPR) repeat protein
MYQAQAQLADAYIAGGHATEARFIAEDLVAREPWEKANIERFRRALELLGEPDPDGLIAARLSGESPFTSTDLIGGEPLFDNPRSSPPAAEEPAGDSEPDREIEELLAQVTQSDEAPPRTAPKPRLKEDHQFQLSANAIDLGSILGDFDDDPPSTRPAPKAHAATDDVEVDLSIVIDDIKPPDAPAGKAKTSESAPEDLDGVFGSLREQSAKRSGLDDAEKEYKRGLALRAKGDIEGCIAALENASRSPKLRFSTSWIIARLYRDRSQMPQALEWLERASQAPAPTADDGHQLLYELADGLENVGETARALAVLLELQADVGAYRDIDQRISRLTKVQA